MAFWFWFSDFSLKWSFRTIIRNFDHNTWIWRHWENFWKIFKVSIFTAWGPQRGNLSLKIYFHKIWSKIVILTNHNTSFQKFWEITVKNWHAKDWRVLSMKDCVLFLWKIDAFFNFWAHLKCVNLWRITVKFPEKTIWEIITTEI